MKKILIPVLIFLIVFITWRLVESQAILGVTSNSRVSVSAASLDFNLNGDEEGSKKINLGEVKPGDSGIVTVTINNVGTIPGTLCVKKDTVSPQFTMQPVETCEVVIEPGSSTQFKIDWSLPASTHNEGLDGTSFEFSFLVHFENGFLVTKQLIFTGTFNDPEDTRTFTPTATITGTLTNTLTSTLTTVTYTPVPTLVGTATNTPTPTYTPSDLPTNVPSVTPAPTVTPAEAPTEAPIAPTETPSMVPTEAPPPTDIPTDITTETPLPTEIPTDVPIETPLPTEIPSAVPSETPLSIFFRASTLNLL